MSLDDDLQQAELNKLKSEPNVTAAQIGVAAAGGIVTHTPATSRHTHRSALRKLLPGGSEVFGRSRWKSR